MVVILGGKRDSHVDDVSDIFFIDPHAETDSGNDAFGLARHETLEVALSLALWQFGMEKAARNLVFFQLFKHLLSVLYCLAVYYPAFLLQLLHPNVVDNTPRYLRFLHCIHLVNQVRPV